MIQIFLVDDNSFMRKSIGQLLELEPDFKICGETATAEETFYRLEEIIPDIALIDISLGGGEQGIQLINDIRAKGYKFPILTISLHEEALYAEQVFKAGAQGYLMKQDACDNIVQAIRSILKGEESFFTLREK